MGLSNETKDIGRFFWHPITLKKKSPIFHTFPTHETDYPYRWSKSLIARLPWSSRGIVLGWWRSADRDEDDAVLAGMSGRGMDYKDYLEEAMEI